MMQTRQVTCLQAIIAVCLCNINIASATDMSSANYAIKWDVTDGGGGNSSSANYIVEAAMGQPTAIGESSSSNYTMVAGFEAVPDSDADTIRNTMDNCTLVANVDQRDTDNDGYGNICDADLNGDLTVDLSDFSLFRIVFATSDPDADFNGDGSVNLTDFSLFRVMFTGAPGPSGLVP